jgi:hypothetical protein
MHRLSAKSMAAVGFVLAQLPLSVELLGGLH